MWQEPNYDVSVDPTGAAWRMRRFRRGLRRLQARVQALRPTRIVLEATGEYERALVPRWPTCLRLSSIRA